MYTHNYAINYFLYEIFQFYFVCSFSFWKALIYLKSNSSLNFMKETSFLKNFILPTI